jgi:ribosomal protein S18 acetylase RimI-like enzyme
MAGNNGPSKKNTGPVASRTLAHSADPLLVPLTAESREAAAQIYTRVFLDDEPTSRRHALDPSLFLPYARIYVRWLETKGLSFLAKDAHTGEISGFIFCFDFLDDPGHDSPLLQEFIGNFRQAVAMIDELEARHISRETVRPGSVLHIFQIGVDRKYRRQGVARELLCRVIDLAGDRGFDRLVADCTSPASREVFRQCGFTQEGFSPYESFLRDGTCFFSGLEGGISLMVRDIPQDA